MSLACVIEPSKRLIVLQHLQFVAYIYQSILDTAATCKWLQKRSLRSVGEFSYDMQIYSIYILYYIYYRFIYVVSLYIYLLLSYHIIPSKPLTSHLFGEICFKVVDKHRGRKHGEGTLCEVDGRVYRGQWRDGKRPLSVWHGEDNMVLIPIFQEKQQKTIEPI